MTIVTKPLTSEKKPVDQLAEPLVTNEQTAGDIEKGKEAGVGKLDGINERYHYILRTRVARVSSATTLCLLITALLVMTVGLFGGLYIYKQMSRHHKYRGFCNVPYTDARVGSPSNDFSGAPLFTIPLTNEQTANRKIDVNGISYVFGSDSDAVAKFFREELELDLDDEKYSKVEVPDFKGGRSGRFIHEFESGKTAIVDKSANRCFIMDMDRTRVLPPKDMLDIVQKMWQGYYSVNTKRVRETMRVVLPPLDESELSELGVYIQEECRDKTSFALTAEKPTGRIVKRSAVSTLPFVEFTGLGTVEYDLVNVAELDNMKNQ